MPPAKQKRLNLSTDEIGSLVKNFHLHKAYLQCPHCRAAGAMVPAANQSAEFPTYCSHCQQFVDVGTLRNFISHRVTSAASPTDLLNLATNDQVPSYITAMIVEINQLKSQQAELLNFQLEITKLRQLLSERDALIAELQDKLAERPLQPSNELSTMDGHSPAPQATVGEKTLKTLLMYPSFITRYENSINKLHVKYIQ
ncbi:hypothetical protein G6F37_013622 [Rhizopus arrhizus]|nr:hypothetical protein G6F38_013547 [Rhizopus arrhizus]KAG1136959.1 hypothetical protein G6F37_013622 [Rhizopus arrhizus]